MTRNVDLFAIGFLLLAIVISSRMRNVIVSAVEARNIGFMHCTRTVIVPVPLPLPAAPPAPFRVMRD